MQLVCVSLPRYLTSSRFSGSLACTLLLVVALLVTLSDASAQDASTEHESPETARRSLATIVAVGVIHHDPRHTYVIVHGMGGTRRDDRFHRLGASIKEAIPEANVYRVDWSDAATRQVYGVTIPLLVAMSIDSVGKEVATHLQAAMVDGSQMTLIGESFGSYVNFQIARQMGGVSSILSFNPASSLGGYPVPALRKYAKTSWAFHTRSPFDTAAEVGHRGILLRPRTDAPWEQHTYGVHWLQQNISKGDLSWLTCQRMVPEGPDGMYDLVVEDDGTIDWEWTPRILPGPEALASK